MKISGKQINGKELVGDPMFFSLEERIFNTVCIIAFIAMCFEVPFNFSIGLIVPASLCVFGAFFAVFLYYLSRFRRKSSLGIKLFCFVCNLLFVINYFFNSGIFGPNLLLFSLAFLLIVTIIPKSQFKIWISLNLISVFTILAVEYLNPTLVTDAYNNELNKVVDFGITYFVTILLTYYAISYIRINYDRERNAVIGQNVAIESQKFELERLNSEKDKLFSIVTHDLRTPLNSIQSYLELLSVADLGEEKSKALKQKLLEITRDTSSMLTNVLSWSKTQMEGSHANLTSLNVKEAIINGLNIEQKLAQKKGIEFKISCEEGLSISADKNMFELVLRNLVNNAIKFTSPHGLVSVNVTPNGCKCHIIVRDNGLGIDKVQQSKLFQLKAVSTFGTNNEKGVGVGLMLCKEFTELQGGEIWFESKIGVGSTFYLSFNLIN